MKLKKLASLVLAIVMVMALAVPAFANSPTYNDKQNQSVTMKGGTQVPKIQIQLPSGAALTNTFLLNPYKLSYKSDSNATVGGVSTLSGAGGSSAPQVISPVLDIVNGTNSRMQVDVTATTTLGGNLKLLTAPYTDTVTTASDTKNNAFLYLNIKGGATAETNSSTTVAAAGYTSGKSIVLKAGDVKATAVLCTEAATPDVPNYIKIQFGGQMAEAPTTPWTEKDVATVALAFTFTPNQNVSVTSAW